MSLVRTSLLLAFALLMLGCSPRRIDTDAARPADAAARDEAGLYLECASECASADQTCLPVSGSTRQTRVCTFTCRSDGECPDGSCALGQGTMPGTEQPRCYERCGSDFDCADLGFRCFPVMLDTPSGARSDDVCLPD